MVTESLDAQGKISEIENPFEEVQVKAFIKKVNLESATGPSGLLRYSHL